MLELITIALFQFASFTSFSGDATPASNGTTVSCTDEHGTNGWGDGHLTDEHGTNGWGDGHLTNDHGTNGWGDGH
ncbi:hypothetical protein [Hymenobacter pini]|uniref:hypothetical protein n=1 Tax=Hymenobacter pini TaxID=2880879 RepID=UPI001CF30A14|nr:hypothetical protein [Hymenobacter pini]MCA8831556.1 hypothetical protein [Hymenobacter pini]